MKDVWDLLTASPSSPFTSWLGLYLGRVVQLLTDESTHAASLFGADRAPIVLCSLLQHALAPLPVPMTEKLFLLCKDSPLPAAEIYVSLDDFAKSVGSFLEGCGSQNIIAALTSLFAGFKTYSDSYGPGEGRYLQTYLAASLHLVSFEAQLTPLGLGGDDEGFDGTGGVDYSDPVEAYEAFGERLVAAADSVYEPTRASLLRSLTLQGGLRVKPVCRALALSLTSHTKLLVGKVDELRIACGFSSDLTAESVKGGNIPDKDGTEQDKEAHQHAVAMAEGWARKLEGADLRGRVLVPSALRAVQVQCDIVN